MISQHLLREQYNTEINGQIRERILLFNLIEFCSDFNEKSLEFAPFTRERKFLDKYNVLV